MTLLDFTLRISFAVLAGFCIGLERQLTGHIAGIRTNVLVCLGACLFTLFSSLVAAPDPSRIAAQVVTGIGFLCSGIIFKEGFNVRGLNTAATIWCTAAVGVLCSTGMALYALVATGILLAANLMFRFVANRIRPIAVFEEEENTYKVSVVCREDDEFAVRAAIMKGLENTRFLLTNLESADVIGSLVEIEATLQLVGRRQDTLAEKLVGRISFEEGVSKVGWELV